MKKIFVVAPLCAFLTACGSDGGSSTKTPTTLPTANTATTTPATDATTNTNASTSDTGTTGTGTANPTTGNGTATPTNGVTTTPSLPTPTDTVYAIKYNRDPDGAKKFATKQLGDGAVVDSVKVKFGDKSYLNPFKKDSINLSYLGKGFFVLPQTSVLNAHLDDKKLTYTIQSYHAVLQQQHSGAKLDYFKQALTSNNGTVSIDNHSSVEYDYSGLFTINLPKQGTATYIGKGYGASLIKGFASDKDIIAYDLNYHVDFANKTGHGTLQGVKNLALDNGIVFESNGKHSVAGAITHNSYRIGAYNLHFFGDNADEIAGRFDTDKEVGIMGGTKQAQQSTDLLKNHSVWGGFLT